VSPADGVRFAIAVRFETVATFAMIKSPLNIVYVATVDVNCMTVRESLYLRYFDFPKSKTLYFEIHIIHP